MVLYILVRDAPQREERRRTREKTHKTRVVPEGYTLNMTKIEWTDVTWNPIVGCYHGCPYCYARKITHRYPKAFPYGFEPHFYPNRLLEPTKEKRPMKIFTVSMGDMFGDWVPIEWHEGILSTIEQCPQHQFQILTKAPWNINKYIDKWPKNVWLGTSIENQDVCEKRLNALKNTHHEGILFASFEPLQGMIESDLSFLDWIILGAQTNPLKYPPSAAIHSVLYRAQLKPVFFKNNLKNCQWVTSFMFRQDYPTQLV
jgi:protein gp37